MATSASHLRLVQAADSAEHPTDPTPASGPFGGTLPTASALRTGALAGAAVHEVPCLPAALSSVAPDATNAMDATSATHATDVLGGSQALGTAPTWEQLFRLYGPYVAQVALRVLGRDDEVDDVVQEVFLAAMADIDKLRNPLAVRGWLKTVTVRKAYRVLKQRGRRRWWAYLGLGDGPDVCAASGTYPLTSPGCNPEERVLLVRIYRLLDELPVNERLAWTLRYIEGEQVESVATLCGCSLATVKRRISAAQTFLARTLDDA